MEPGTLQARALVLELARPKEAPALPQAQALVVDQLMRTTKEAPPRAKAQELAKALPVAGPQAARRQARVLVAGLLRSMALAAPVARELVQALVAAAKHRLAPCHLAQ